MRRTWTRSSFFRSECAGPWRPNQGGRASPRAARTCHNPKADVVRDHNTSLASVTTDRGDAIPPGWGSPPLGTPSGNLNRSFGAWSDYYPRSYRCAIALLVISQVDKLTT